MRRTALAIGVASALLLGGCAGITITKEITRDTEQLKSGDVAKMREMLDHEQAKAAPPALVEDVSSAFVGNEQVSAPKMTQWPPALRRDTKVTLVFSTNTQDPAGNVVVPLAELAHEIQAVTGIPVRVKPDALIDAAGKPVFATLPARYVGSVPEILAQIEGKHRVFATYEGNALEFFRTQTRTFLLGLPLGDTTFDFNATTGGGIGSASAKMGSITKASFVPEKEVINGVKKYLSKGVEPVYDASTGLLTVTDTPDVLDAVSSFIDRVKQLNGREVRFDVKVVRYTQTTKGESGVNWSALYRRIQSMSGTSVRFTGPVPDVSPGDGSFGVTAVPGANGSSRFDGSSIVVQALNEVGNATVVNTRTLSTVNNYAVTQAFSKDIDYVNETTASTTLAGVAVGQKTKQESVSRMLMLVPTIRSETDAMVEIAIREQTLNPFKSNTIGSGQTQQTVQLLDKDTELMRQRIVLHNGETRVLANIGRVLAEGNERSLDRSLSAAAGGMASGNRSDEQYFLVMTMHFLN